MRPRISIRGYGRPSVRLSVCRSITLSSKISLDRCPVELTRAVVSNVRPENVRDRRTGAPKESTRTSPKFDALLSPVTLYKYMEPSRAPIRQNMWLAQKQKNTGLRDRGHKRSTPAQQISASWGVWFCFYRYVGKVGGLTTRPSFSEEKRQFSTRVTSELETPHSLFFACVSSTYWGMPTPLLRGGFPTSNRRFLYKLAAAVFLFNGFFNSIWRLDFVSKSGLPVFSVTSA